MIRVRNITKTFKSFTAVKGISFDVEQGEIFAFLGPNGAGKTTTMKMLTTMLSPSSGTIELDGINTVRHQMAARKKFGIVFQDPSLDDQQTAYENLELHGILYGCQGNFGSSESSSYSPSSSCGTGARIL